MEIERFRRNFRPPGYVRIHYTHFWKIFQKWRPFWIFKFSPKSAKTQNFSISLTVGDRAISSKFSTPRVSKKYTDNFWKNFQKWRPFWIFEFSPKSAKTQNCSISLTVGDRAISSKFSTPRVFKELHYDNFLKKFSKMAAILNFRIFAKNVKTQNFCYLLNR